MDRKQIAREIVEKEFRRNKGKNKNTDYSSGEEEVDSRRKKRPLITPSQIKTKDSKLSAADSKYRDRAQERREGRFKKDDKVDAFDWNEDRNGEPISVPKKEKEDPVHSECIDSQFETREQAQEYLQSNPASSTVLGRAIIRFWQTRWQKVNPKSPLKLSSSVYTMTTATHPPLQIMPSEKTYPLITNKGLRPLLPDDLLQRINRACSSTKERGRIMANGNATSNEGPSTNPSSDEDDIFGDLGQYDEQDDIDQDASVLTRKGEKIILFEQEELEIAPAVEVTVQPQSQRLEGFLPAIAEIDYHEDESSGDEKKHKKKKRKRQRSGSDSA